LAAKAENRREIRKYELKNEQKNQILDGKMEKRKWEKKSGNKKSTRRDK